jgi:hypothetical protein
MKIINPYQDQYLLFDIFQDKKKAAFQPLLGIKSWQ